MRIASMPLRPTAIATANEGTIPIARVIALRFQGVSFHPSDTEEGQQHLTATRERRVDERMKPSETICPDKVTVSDAAVAEANKATANK